MAIMYRAWFSLRSPARDSRCRMTWPLEASSGAVPVWAANVADLAKEPGRQHRPDPKQPDQAGVGLGDRGLDARLDRGDLLLQVTDVRDELAGQLPADDRRRSGRSNLVEQRGGPLGGEVALRLLWVVKRL